MISWENVADGEATLSAVILNEMLAILEGFPELTRQVLEIEGREPEVQGNCRPAGPRRGRGHLGDPRTAKRFTQGRGLFSLAPHKRRLSR